ncbi:hypothetical protein LSH36_573g00009 [Paralvinella palmiformis]|uniref:Uncharacterized protein n=1 Tax=Paralvinella palmiformis TaxID=53620 RepID=A0AAD9J5S5_9ANNE|nr:hypothetical protein LSH36_573g00009 [Paralvinella palmiformis]
MCKQKRYVKKKPGLKTNPFGHKNKGKDKEKSSPKNLYYDISDGITGDETEQELYSEIKEESPNGTNKVTASKDVRINPTKTNPEVSHSKDDSITERNIELDHIKNNEQTKKTAERKVNKGDLYAKIDKTKKKKSGPNNESENIKLKSSLVDTKLSPKYKEKRTEQKEVIRQQLQENVRMDPEDGPITSNENRQDRKKVQTIESSRKATTKGNTSLSTAEDRRKIIPKVPPKLNKQKSDEVSSSKGSHNKENTERVTLPSKLINKSPRGDISDELYDQTCINEQEDDSLQELYYNVSACKSVTKDEIKVTSKETEINQKKGKDKTVTRNDSEVELYAEVEEVDHHFKEDLITKSETKRDDVKKKGKPLPRLFGPRKKNKDKININKEIADDINMPYDDIDNDRINDNMSNEELYSEIKVGIVHTKSTPSILKDIKPTKTRNIHLDKMKSKETLKKDPEIVSELKSKETTKNDPEDVSEIKMLYAKIDKTKKKAIINPESGDIKTKIESSVDVAKPEITHTRQEYTEREKDVTTKGNTSLSTADDRSKIVPKVPPKLNKQKSDEWSHDKENKQRVPSKLRNKTPRGDTHKNVSDELYDQTSIGEQDDKTIAKNGKKMITSKEAEAKQEKTEKVSTSDLEVELYAEVKEDLKTKPDVKSNNIKKKANLFKRLFRRRKKTEEQEDISKEKDALYDDIHEDNKLDDMTEDELYSEIKVNSEDKTIDPRTVPPKIEQKQSRNTTNKPKRNIGVEKPKNVVDDTKEEDVISPKINKTKKREINNFQSKVSADIKHKLKVGEQRIEEQVTDEDSPTDVTVKDSTDVNKVWGRKSSDKKLVKRSDARDETRNDSGASIGERKKKLLNNKPKTKINVPSDQKYNDHSVTSKKPPAIRDLEKSDVDVCEDHHSGLYSEISGQQQSVMTRLLDTEDTEMIDNINYLRV